VRTADADSDFATALTSGAARLFEWSVVFIVVSFLRRGWS
jgi:hypothetical protein